MNNMLEKQFAFSTLSKFSYVGDYLSTFRDNTINAIQEGVRYLGNEVFMELYLFAPHDVTDKDNCGSRYKVEKLYIEDEEIGTMVLMHNLEDDTTYSENLIDLSANELYEIAKHIESLICQVIYERYTSTETR